MGNVCLSGSCSGGSCDTFIDCYADGDGDGYGAGTPVSRVICLSGEVDVGGDCDDNPSFCGDDCHPGAIEICDGYDNDCNGQVDELGGGECYEIADCVGTVDCSSYSAGSDGSGCPAGCDVDVAYGRCSDAGNYCTMDSDCTSGTCDGFGGYSCVGFASCTRFSNQLFVCDGYGCASACDGYVTRESCESAGCTYECGSKPDYEICSDGLDNDGDGLVDCMDPDCQVGSSYVSDAEADDLNCLGSPQTGNETRSWYCGVSLQDESVGLCCQDGERPMFAAGMWLCTSSNPCDPSGPFTCDFYYDSEFSSWIGSEGASTDSKWCVAPADGRACCSVVHFASLEYWDDEASGNVKVY